MKQKNESIVFALSGAQLASFLAPHGFYVQSNLGAKELTRRYLRLSDGGLRGRMCDVFGIAHARLIARA